MKELIRNKQIISHDLLTEVLGTKAYQMTGKGINWLLNIRDNDIVYESYAEQQYLIDADQLGRLCKEYTSRLGYCLTSFQDIHKTTFNYKDDIEYGNKFAKCYVNLKITDSENRHPHYATYLKVFDSETEIEAIVKATEYVYNKIKGEMKDEF